MGTQFRQIPSVLSWIKIKPGIWKYQRKRLKTYQGLEIFIYVLKPEIFKMANKIHLSAKKLSLFKIQSLYLAKSDVCVIVNVSTVYDKNQTA